jgi:hypothetical protein
MKAIFQSKYAGLSIQIEEKETKRSNKNVLSLSKIQFVGGRYTTEKQDEIEFLRQHTGFGSDYWELSTDDQKIVTEAQDQVLRRRAPAKP